MKKLRKLTVILFVLLLAFSLSACGGGAGDTPCEVCVDENGDGICDVCKEKMPASDVKDIVLVEGGEADFQIIIADDASAAVRQAVNTNIKAVFRNKHNIDINVYTENSKDDKESEIEILVGEINSRDEKYAFDGHELGKEGYAIRIVGSKILINAGSEEMLVEAINKFATEILFADDPQNVVMKASDAVERPQTGYKITSVKVNGNDMKGYTLAVDLSREGYEAIALDIQNTFYVRAGYWLDIVDIDEATDKSFIVKNVPKVSGDESYKISAKDSQLIIECAYDNMLSKATNTFLRDVFLLKTGDVDFKGTVYTKDISVLHYEDFGAKGDGETDDFKAIYDTHVTANQGGQIVLGNPDATYYIFNARIDGIATPIPIRTSVDWQGAQFIIDDSALATMSGGENHDLAKTDIFMVLPDEDQMMFKITDKEVLERIATEGINPTTTEINLGLDWDGDVLIIPYNSSHQVFRRRGYYGQSADMHEIIVVHKDGTRSEETPIMFDYTTIDYIEVYKLDDSRAITIENGNFTTRDTRINQNVNGTWAGGYIARGINVQRAYTMVENVNHAVVGGFTFAERLNGYDGNITSGFFRSNYTSNVTFKNCDIPARMSYGGTGSSTYNFNATHVNKVVLENCVQTNFWITIDPETYAISNATIRDPEARGNARKATENAVIAMQPYVVDGVSYNLYYGYCGSNYCKNMEYINSTASRFDAHQAIYTGKVINSNITDLELTGYGEFLFENSSFYQYNLTTPLFFLRSDYGYTWNGTLIAKNIDAYTHDGYEFPIIRNTYNNWYFGYTCSFPNIDIDNLDLYSLETGEARPKDYAVSICGLGDSELRKHLIDGDQSVVLDVVDKDGDGYIDEPIFDINRDNIVDETDLIDIDKNGDPYNTSLRFADYYNEETQSHKYGAIYEACKINVNIVRPPEFIRIVNNDGVDGKGGYVFKLRNTARDGISDGNWWDDVESNGGFFGDTTFIYVSAGETKSFKGTKRNYSASPFSFFS